MKLDWFNKKEESKKSDQKRAARISLNNKKSKRLFESEEKYKMIFENANDIIMYVNRYGKILEINKKIRDILGYKHSDVVGKNFAKIGALTVKELPRMIKLLLESVRKGAVLGGGTTNIMELNLRHKNGKMVPLESSTSIIKKNGKVEGYLNVLRDISERKKAELNFRLLFESSKDAMMTLAPPSWKFTSGNKSIIKMFNVRNEKEFTTLGPWELSPKYQTDGQLSSVKAKKMISKAMKTGYNFFEWAHKRLHGEDFPATVLLTKIDLGNGDSFLQATVRDITENKKSEDKLHESEERYRTLIENSYDIIQSVGPDGHFKFVNKSWHDTLGYTREELPKLTMFDIIHPDSLEHCKKIFQKVMSGNSVKNIEAKFITKNKRTLLVEGNAAPRYYGSKIVSTQGFFRDVTERRKIEEEKKKKSEELEKSKKELEEKVHDLEIFTRLTVGRELKMTELKEKIKEMEKKEGGKR